MPRTTNPADALVFFGATGDLAYKKIFPAIQTLIQHGHLEVPIVGVAKSGWGLEDLIARARSSLENHGGIDEAAFARLEKRLRYVDGDYNEASTFEQLREALALQSGRFTTWRSRRVFSERSRSTWPGPAVPMTRVS